MTTTFTLVLTAGTNSSPSNTAEKHTRKARR